MLMYGNMPKMTINDKIFSCYPYLAYPVFLCWEVAMLPIVFIFEQQTPIEVR
jgi:hypothetical protein